MLHICYNITLYIATYFDPQGIIIRERTHIRNTCLTSMSTICSWVVCSIQRRDLDSLTGPPQRFFPLPLTAVRLHLITLWTHLHAVKSWPRCHRCHESRQSCEVTLRLHSKGMRNIAITAPLGGASARMTSCTVVVIRTAVPVLCWAK